MSNEHEEFVDDFISRLGIMWKVDYLYGDLEDPRLVSDPVGKNHQLVFPIWFEKESSAHKSEVLKMLSLAKIGESRDPLFATLRFRKEFDIEDASFQRAAQMIFQSQQITEVWATDLMRTVDKQLARADALDNFRLIGSYPDEIVNNLGPFVINFYAGAYSSIKRGRFTDLEEPLKEFRARMGRIFDDEVLGMFDQMANLYANVPELSKERSEALKLLEQKTQESAEILGFPVIPAIYHDPEGFNVWNYSEILSRDLMG